MNNVKISPSKEDEFVLQAIRDVVKRFTPTSRVFVTGGWVRDHLMGLNPNDLDVMIDNMSGEAFARMITRFLGTRDAHTIRDNPDKSKHVETAKAYIPLPWGGTKEVDFVQARKEVYDAQSRVPTDVTPTTPEEDAFRRDLTINAIFYDIVNDRIEDFTGQGMPDLGNRLLRSPGAPQERFGEDPLRILRVARFAAKLGWKIDPETYKAMADPKLLDLLTKKVSRERIGVEFSKLMQSKYPQYGLRIMYDIGVIPQLLADATRGSPYEGKLSPFTMGQNNVHHQLTLWDHTLAVLDNLLRQYPNASPEKRLLLALSVFGHDMGKMFKDIQKPKPDGGTSYHEHEDHSPQILDLFLKHIHLHPLVRDTSLITKFHMRPYSLKSASDKAIRKFLREMADSCIEWVDVINHSIADAMSKSSPSDNPDPETLTEVQELTDLRKRIAALEVELSSQGKPTNACILNGNEIMQAMGRQDSGQWVGTIKAWLLDKQDENPALSKEEATQLIKGNFPEYMTKQVVSSTIPTHLFQGRVQQITEAMSSRPYEAYSLAKELFKNHPDDDNAIMLLGKVIVAAGAADSRLLDQEVRNHMNKLAEDRLFNPMILCLSAIMNKLFCKTLSEQDTTRLKRAMQLDARITIEMVKGAQGILGEEAIRGLIKQ